jgi:hypothetical protein
VCLGMERVPASFLRVEEQQRLNAQLERQRREGKRTTGCPGGAPTCGGDVVKDGREAGRLWALSGLQSPYLRHMNLVRGAPRWPPWQQARDRATQGH